MCLTRFCSCVTSVLFVLARFSSVLFVMHIVCFFWYDSLAFCNAAFVLWHASSVLFHFVLWHASSVLSDMILMLFWYARLHVLFAPMLYLFACLIWCVGIQLYSFSLSHARLVYLSTCLLSAFVYCLCMMLLCLFWLTCPSVFVVLFFSGHARVMCFGMQMYSLGRGCSACLVCLFLPVSACMHWRVAECLRLCSHVMFVFLFGGCFIWLAVEQGFSTGLVLRCSWSVRVLFHSFLNNA